VSISSLSFPYLSLLDPSTWFLACLLVLFPSITSPASFLISSHLPCA
jgi:hypothetical protein